LDDLGPKMETASPVKVKVDEAPVDIVELKNDMSIFRER
jgi:hypothetical protein